MPRYKRKITMVERIKETKNLDSILFIYSQADSWTPPEMGRSFQQNCPVPSEFWEIEHAQHASIMKSEHREEYTQKILAYFDQATRD